MDRRKFLHSLNAISVSAALPAIALASESRLPRESLGVVLEGKTPSSSTNETSAQSTPRIALVSVGGFGSQIAEKLLGDMLAITLRRVIVIDTDSVQMRGNGADINILIGNGKAPPKSIRAVQRLMEAALPQIQEAVAGMDFVVLAVGMGGVSGTSIAPVVARLLSEREIATLAFVTQPSATEGQDQRQRAEVGMRELRKHVRNVVLFSDDGTPSNSAITEVAANHRNAISTAIELCRSITNSLSPDAYVGIDLEDIANLILDHGGDCAFGYGVGDISGAIKAIQQAIDHPPLGHRRLEQASAILVAIEYRSGQSNQFTLRMCKEIMTTVRAQISPEAWLLCCATLRPTLDENCIISILASGIGKG